jgi:competence protein ComEC
MAIAPAIPVGPAKASAAVPPAPVLDDAIWRAPLVPAALALTAGIVLDRAAGVPLGISLFMALAGLAAAGAACLGRQTGLAFLYSWATVAALGAACHEWWRTSFPADDIGEFTTADPRPARLRGYVAEEPAVALHPPKDDLQSFARADPTVAVVEVSQVHDRRAWQPASGRARLVVAGKLTGVHVGDEVEVVGRLIKPLAPANPGEFDYASFLLDQRIRAIFSVGKTPDGVTRLAEGWSWSPARILPLVRGWGQQTLEAEIPPRYAGVAAALLLGENSLMTAQDWDKYIHTGVIHVLAISGQHLVVLAGFLWAVLRLLRVRRRHGAWFIALFLLGYSLLAGGRPPVMRSAVMVCALCLGLILQRPVLRANSFALAWIVVAVLNPTDLFGAGCQLSFLCVAILYWGTNHWVQSSADPLDAVIDQTRPAWWRFVRSVLRAVLTTYLVTLAIWLAIAPLVAARYHTVPVVGLLIGPVTVLLTAVALLAGFLMLLLAAICWPLVPAVSWAVTASLAACEWVVTASESVRGAFYYVGDIPEWWLWVFYLGFLATLMIEPIRRRWHWAMVAGLAWVCLGLISGWSRPAADELRCTFLAVGHGGCTILETPDGRTLLYDAGAISGPDVARRQIAPFLWNRGVRRIDEVFLSQERHHSIPGAGAVPV